MRPGKSARKKHKIVFACQDPGGALAILSIIKKVKPLCLEIKIFAGAFSDYIFKKNKIKFIRADKYRFDKLLAEIKEFNPDLVIAGNSFGFSVDKKVLRAARYLKVPSISIIDYWSNYWLRFNKPEEGRRLENLPNHIIVIDDLMRREMVAAGFPPKKLKVLGNPHFDSFQRINKISIKSPIQKIIFISQPLRQIYNSTGEINYDEYSVFSELIFVLKNLEKKIKQPKLIVRLHPKEEREKFDQFKRSGNFIVSQFAPLSGLINKNNLFVGMTSAVLFQAGLSGAPTISYQPGLKDPQKDTLISNRLGFSQLVRNRKDLEKTILQVLTGHILISKNARKLAERYLNNKSTEKIMDFIFNILRQHEK